MAANVNARVNAKDVEDLVEGLRWISSPPFARKAFALSRIKQEILDYLRLIFPVSDPKWRHGSHLVTGFRAYDTFDRNNQVGFIVKHNDIGNLRTKAILTSLEYGSKGYYVRPDAPNGNGFGLFTFFPGDQRGFRKGSGMPDFAMRKRIHIPARSGIHYMRETLKLAEKLVAKQKPEFFKEAKKAIKQKKKS